MTPLDPDHPPIEGAASHHGTRGSLAADPGTTSRRAAGAATATTSSTSRPAQRRGTLPAAGPVSGASSGRGRKARTITATVARTATATAARTASAAAKAAATGARVATTKAAAARAGTAARATGRKASATPAPAAKTTAAKTTAAKTTAAKAPAAKAPAAKAPAATTPARTPSARSTATSPVVPAADPVVVRRPTPYPRTPQPVEPPAFAAADERPSGVAAVLRHRPPSVRRRPSLYLAAALATVIGVSGGISSVSPAAQADTTTAVASVSVAERLGLTAGTAQPIVDAETTDRLGELVASRAERDAEKSQAARVQAKADQAAAVAERRAAAAAAEAARPKAALPVKGARLTSGFGARWGTLHAGIDLAAPMHTPEYAVMDGVVLEAGPASGFGLAVYIQHENGDVTVYGHMDRILVSAGQVVQAGDTIALLGNTGQSTGPHLHFEVHQGGLHGTKIDPLPWLRERGLEI